MQINHVQTLHLHLPAGMQILGAEGFALDRALTSDTPIATPAPQAAPVAHGELWPGQGGYFIATLPALHHLPARHLILATEEKEDLTWGRRGEEVPDAGSHFDSCANTMALLKHGDHPAAQWAAAYQADGHHDFYLPSRLDLLMCYLAAPQLFKKEGWYWSSTQSSRYCAWCQAFESGFSYTYGKDDEFRARPVRMISL